MALPLVVRTGEHRSIVWRNVMLAATVVLTIQVGVGLMACSLLVGAWVLPPMMVTLCAVSTASTLGVGVVRALQSPLDRLEATA